MIKKRSLLYQKLINIKKMYANQSVDNTHLTLKLYKCNTYCANLYVASIEMKNIELAPLMCILFGCCLGISYTNDKSLLNCLMAVMMDC